MLTTIITSSILLMCLYLLYKIKDSIFVLFLTVSSFFYLVIHIALWIPRKYTYDLAEAKRNAIQESIDFSRKNGYKMESATVLKDVIEWNKYLAETKIKNKTIFLGQYIDDRFEYLEPIR